MSSSKETSTGARREVMNTYYVTVAANHPGGCGYWEVKAQDETEARERAFDSLGSKWSFIYSTLEEVHPLDRKRHGRLG